MAVKTSKSELYTVGDNIRKLRDERNLSQEELADMLGLKTYKTVGEWERAITSPNFDKIMKMCEIFDCDADYLLGRIDCRTHDALFIREQTGLSEAAIDKLKAMNRRNRITRRIDTLSHLVEHESFEYFISLLSAESPGEYEDMVNNALVRVERQAVIRNEIRVVVERIAESVLEQTRKDGIDEGAREMYKILFYQHEQGKMTDDEFEETIAAFDAGDFDYLPETYKLRIQEGKKHGN